MKETIVITPNGDSTYTISSNYFETTTSNSKNTVKDLIKDCIMLGSYKITLEKVKE